MENKKYVDNDFTLPGPPKGKHTLENVPTLKPKEPIKVDDKEEEHEDSGGLEHRGWRKPMDRVEDDRA
ncbi:hypothetical protein KI387_008051, partial [Taxus chinensis]